MSGSWVVETVHSRQCLYLIHIGKDGVTCLGGLVQSTVSCAYSTSSYTYLAINIDCIRTSALRHPMTGL
jgi:hypothetical protein